MKNFFAVLLFFLLSFSLFCQNQQRIISPVDGDFANKQFLAIELKPGEEAFYSFSSSGEASNPLEYGFAYDSPVLIDLSGKIDLKIAVLPKPDDSLDSTENISEDFNDNFLDEDSENSFDKNPGHFDFSDSSNLSDSSFQADSFLENSASKNIEHYEIKYSVQENSNSFDENSEKSAFIKKILKNEMILCSGSVSLKIPSGLKFSLGNGEKPFISGTELSVSPENCLSRLIPCTVTDGKQEWRFIISLRGKTSERIFSQINSDENVPFEIKDWFTFQFNRKNFIWSIDDGIWSASKEPVFLERSRPHTIRWQSVAYEKGNPVKTFVLPPKPELEKFYEDGAAYFTLKGDDNYKMQIISDGLGEKSENDKNDSLYAQVIFDTFDGDSISGKAEFGIFYDGVFQGKLFSEYEIDKQPPLPPVFNADEKGFYVRSDVELKIEAEDESKIYYAISGPNELSAGTYSEDSPELDVKLSNFKPYNFKKIKLRSGKKSAVFYKIAAFAVDKAGNKSSISEYKLIIDEFNYFIDFGFSGENSDGSKNRPFNNLAQILKVINSSDFSHFYVSGNFVIGKNTEILSNCAFTGTGDPRSKITFSPESFLTVKNSSISFANCYIQKSFFKTENSDSRMIVLENSAAEFNGCQIFGNFSENGILISSEKSMLNFLSSNLVCQASSYACVLSAISSEISSEKSTFAAKAETSVAASVSKSRLDLKNSACAVSGHIGRIVEAESSNLKMSKNKFSADFDEKKRGVKSIYKDQKTLIIEDSENIEEGF